jgi:3-oxoacyl-[acyl-carrier protein] reductase
MSSILQGKSAAVFGAGGSIGAAVAKEFAAQGARLFLSGRSKANVEATAREVSALGGQSHVAVVDVADPVAVDSYVEAIAQEAGRVDIAFNASGPAPQSYGNGTLAVDLTAEQFAVALNDVVKPQFITARAAARQMTKQHSGVILFQTGSTARGHIAGGTAIGAAFGAIETFSENLSFEVSPLGVRVVCLRTTANIDTAVIQQTMDIMAAKMSVPKDQLIARFADMNFLKIPASAADTARALAFLASDGARMFTATVVNSTAGAALD